MSKSLPHHRFYLIATFGFVGTLAFSATHLPAAVVLPNLPAGSQYQLIFVTAGTTDATSANIDDYNSFVSQQAALNSSLPATTWKAIGSTQTVNANQNVATYSSIPIYNTDGLLVASGSAQFWSGIIENPIIYNQYGMMESGQTVWTGTEPPGIGAIQYHIVGGLGAPDDGNWPFTYTGTNDSTYIHWQWDIMQLRTEDFPMYALSDPITVPGTVPEPTTVIIWSLLGGIGIAVAHLRRRKAA